MSQPLSLDDLYTVEDFAKQHPNITTVEGLLWQIRNRAQNGIAAAGVVVKPGKKWLISKTRYEHWLATLAKVRHG